MPAQSPIVPFALVEEQRPNRLGIPTEGVACCSSDRVRSVKQRSQAGLSVQSQSCALGREIADNRFYRE